MSKDRTKIFNEGGVVDWLGVFGCILDLVSVLKSDEFFIGKLNPKVLEIIIR